MAGRTMWNAGAITLLRENPYEFLTPEAPRRPKPRRTRRGKAKMA